MTAPRPDLRLIVITDAALAAPRSVPDIVAAALRGGAPAIQLRDKRASARELFELACRVLPLVQQHDALLFINDRLDVALAAGAHGIHVGPDDMPVAAARMIVPPGFLIGFSTDEPGDAVAAQQAGADYIGCGAVFGTTSKPEVGSERIGTARLAEVAGAVTIPVVGIGGIDSRNIGQIPATGASGAAVLGAVMTAPDPEAAVRTLLAAMRRM